MKKLIALLLAMVILLCGCAAGTAIKEEKALSELGEGMREESVAIVKVTINPEFELYLDLNMCVSKVRCLNADAVTTLEAAQANLVGSDYGSVMFAILNSAAQTGFLTEGAQVKIETTLHTPMAEQDLAYMAQSMANPVEVYSANSGLALSVESATPTVDEKAVEAFMKAYEDQTKNQPGGNQSDKLSGSYTGDIKDEKGNRIGTAESLYDENGNLLSQTLNFDDGTSSYSTYEYDANGNMIKEEYVNSDGYSGVNTYFANGNIEASKWIAPDGQIITQTYYESGVIKSSISDYDGNHHECYYAEDGTLIDEVIEERPWNMGEPNSVVEQEISGSHGQGISTLYFDENGSLYKAVDVYPDGATYENTYYESGNVKSSKWNDQTGSGFAFFAEDGSPLTNIGEPNGVLVTSISDGGTSTRYFDENGYLYREVLEYPGKTPSEFTYYQNGNKETEIFDHDDTHYEHHYYEDGTFQATYQTDIHGNYSEDTYYPNGNRATQIIRYIYGAYWDRTFYENGNMKSEISNDPNADSTAWQYTESYYYENGQLQKFIGSQPNGNYQEQHFYSNGQMAVNIIKDADGYYFEVRFDESGNVTYDSNYS